MEKPLRIIYYLILIVLTLVILISILIPDWKTRWVSGKKNNVDELDDGEGDMVSEIGEDCSVQNGSGALICPTNYALPSQHFTILSEPAETEATITYQKFVSMAQTNKFVHTYAKSILNSFSEKVKIYSKRKKQIERDLAIAQKKSGGTFGASSLDTNLEKLRKMKVEIDSILSALEERISSLTPDQVRKDLKSAIYNRKNGMESLIGREDVKNLLARQIYAFSRNYKIFLTNFQNMVIYGRSGVGKTKLAETIGYVFARSGILVRRKFRAFTQQDFTTAYVNESANITRTLLWSMLEGVAFIDEAYGMSPPKNMFGNMGINHGHEAITELVNFLDKNMGLSVVIAAGYEKEMEERFMESNEGMPRRFPNKIRLTNYTSKQLTDILLKFMRESHPELIMGQYEASYIYGILHKLLEGNSDMFDKQAGDMKIVSGSLASSIYASTSRTWKNNDYTNNCAMLLTGFNSYLREKGISLNIDSIDQVFPDNSIKNQENIGTLNLADRYNSLLT